MRVLLVEDDLSIARSLETALNNQGFTVDAVTTGEVAPQLVANALSKQLPVIKKYAVG